MMGYEFQAKIDLRDYHFKKNVILDNKKAGDKMTVEQETDNESIKIDPYCCASKALIGNSSQLKTIGDIPRAISRHADFSLKEENCNFVGSVYPMKNCPSPILVGGLKISLHLNFKSTHLSPTQRQGLHYFVILVQIRC